MSVCAECGSMLTAEESFYYEYRCEGCESSWHERIERWRRGGEDKELDDLYDNPRRYSFH